MMAGRVFQLNLSGTDHLKLVQLMKATTKKSYLASELALLPDSDPLRRLMDLAVAITLYLKAFLGDGSPDYFYFAYLRPCPNVPYLFLRRYHPHLSYDQPKN